MKYILLLILSIGIISCSHSITERKIASEDVIIVQRSTKIKRHGVIWNSVSEGLKKSLRIRFIRPQEGSKIAKLDAFFWFDFKNLITRGLVAGTIGLGKADLTNNEDLYLNLENGYIYLGERKVGIAQAHPDHHGHIIDSGFKFTVPIEINERNNTVTIN